MQGLIFQQISLTGEKISSITGLSQSGHRKVFMELESWSLIQTRFSGLFTPEVKLVLYYVTLIVSLLDFYIFIISLEGKFLHLASCRSMTSLVAFKKSKTTKIIILRSLIVSRKALVRFPVFNHSRVLWHTSLHDVSNKSKFAEKYSS